MSKRSRRIERRTRRKSWRTTCQESQEKGTLQAELSTNKKCIFCGATGDLQQHHCVQKRFNGPDTPENLVWICPSCHRTFHIISDRNLSHILRHKNIENHEERIEPIAPPVQYTPSVPLPPPIEKTVQPIYISGGQVTITINN